jgi:NCAIR mutase (PurE)-related protein
MENIKHILEQVASGGLPVDEAVGRIGAISSGSLEEITDATVDHGRAARCGFPEVIFAEGKTAEQTIDIIRAILGRSGFVLATRVPAETAADIFKHWPEADYNMKARTVLVGKPPAMKGGAGEVAVVAAGTSDLPVAEEALVTVAAMGVKATLIADVGVAGLHRILSHSATLQSAAAVVVVAGMEGALPSVVGGLVSCPVVAVPTSVGYGASFGGIAALLGMLNSCASGVSVVNIDNGFGGGTVAARIALATAKTE